MDKIRGVAADSSLSEEEVQNEIVEIRQRHSQRNREDYVNEKFSHHLEPLLNQIKMEKSVIDSFKRGVDLLLQQTLDDDLETYDQMTFIHDICAILDHCDDGQREQIKEFCLRIAADDEQKAYINSLVEEAQSYTSETLKAEAKKMTDDSAQRNNGEDEYIDDDGNILDEEQYKNQQDRSDKEYRKKMNKTV